MSVDKSSFFVKIVAKKFLFQKVDLTKENVVVAVVLLPIEGLKEMKLLNVKNVEKTLNRLGQIKSFVLKNVFMLFIKNPLKFAKPVEKNLYLI